MSKLPDAFALGERQSPQPSGGVAQFQTPNTAQAGAILERAGNSVQRAGEILYQFNEKQDQITAAHAVNQLKKSALDLQLNPDNGFVNAKGNSVVDPNFTNGYIEKLQASRQAIAQGLTSGNQRRLFDEQSEVIALQFQSNLYQHKAKATIDFNRQTRTDTVELALTDVATHWADQDTFDTSMLIAGKALVDNATDLGLEGEAKANYVNNEMAKIRSKALMYRTEGMLIDNPMEAAKFFHKNELDFDPQTRIQLGNQIKNATDAQMVRAGGLKAYNDAVSKYSNNAPLPQNFNANFVKPYDEKLIVSRVELVKKPSKYDSLFEKWGAITNTSPTEIKLRAATESGFNPNAVSPAGALGLMQFMPATAKQWGVENPMDPEQAIAGVARMMAAKGGTLGSDMSKFDRLYYGGNATAKGPNTDQYVENLRALRVQLYGASEEPLTLAKLNASEGDVIRNAKAQAEAFRPGDAVVREQFVADALKNLNQNKSVLQSQNNAAVSTILAEIQGGVRSFSDLSPGAKKAYSSLGPESQLKIEERFGKDIPTTEQTQRLRYSLQGMAQNNPEEFAKKDLSDLAGKLPHGDFNYLAGLQQSINSRENRQAAKDASYTQAMSVAQKYVLNSVGLTPPTQTSTEKHKEQFNLFSGLFVDQLESFQAENKRPPTHPEIIKIARNLTAEVTVERPFWFNKEVPIYKLSPEEEAKVIANIPADFKNNMMQALKKRGIVATDSMIQQAYLNSQLRPPKRGQ